MATVTTAHPTDAFLSPEVGSFFMSPPPPTFAAQDYVFAQELAPSSSGATLDFPQVSAEYPPLMSPDLLQLFGSSDLMSMQVAPQFMAAAQEYISHPITLSFPPEILAHVSAPSSQGECTIISHPCLDLRGELPSATSWSSYMEELSTPLSFQTPQNILLHSSLSLSPKMTRGQAPLTQIKQESKPSSQAYSSTALQKLHQRLLQRLRKSQHDSPTTEQMDSSTERNVWYEEESAAVSESSRKADSSFNKVLELFSYYFNTQKTASPLACTAALYLGQVGFELQKRYDAYSRYVKCGVLEEVLVSMSRAAKLRKLGIKSYEEFLRAEVSELRRIKDPERYLNRRMQVFQSYEPEELEGVYLSFDALYLLAKKPPCFRKEWLEEGKVRIVHICEIHEAWRSSPLNKTKRARSPEGEEACDSNPKPAKSLKASV